MNVSKIKSFFLDNKKSLFYAVFFLFSFFLFSDLAFANNATWGTWESDTINEVIKVVNYILVMSSALLWAATAMISLFLTPGWVNGTVFGLDSYMKDMWIMISNIVYFAFAFILITIAFMNIIGKWDKWELKSALPKFIVWVVMVPFTWFFVQFILSISAILTVWVLTLPYDSFESKSTYQDAIKQMEAIISNPENQNTSWDQANEWIPTTFILNLSQNLVPASWENGASVKKKEEFLVQWNDKKITEILKWDGASGHENSIFWVLGLYTYGIMQIQHLDTENGWLFWEAISDITDMTLKLVFDALFIIVYLVLMIALFLALLVRGIKLWVYAMLSPTFGLLYFFDKTDGVWSGSAKFGIKDFISLALVPVYVAAALSFGLLFIMVSSYGMWTSSLLAKCTTEDLAGIESSVSPDKMNCMNIGSFTFAIQWAVWESTWWAPSGWAFGRIIMQLFGIVVLWLAVMMALKQSEITEQIAKPIWDFWNSVWWLVAKSPMYAPIIPGGLSVTWLKSAWSTVTSAVEQRSSRQWSDFAQQNFPWLFWENFKKLNDATINLRSAAQDMDKYNRSRELIATAWSAQALADNKPAREALADAFKSIRSWAFGFDVSEERIDELRNASSADAVRWILRDIERKARSEQHTILWTRSERDVQTSDQVDSAIRRMSPTENPIEATLSSSPSSAQIQQVTNKAWDKIDLNINPSNNARDISTDIRTTLWFNENESIDSSTLTDIRNKLNDIEDLDGKVDAIITWLKPTSTD